MALMFVADTATLRYVDICRLDRPRNAMTNRFHRLFEAESLPPNASRAVEVDGHDILVCNAGGEFFAIENRCTHQGSELEGGRIRHCTISCPLHGAKFNLRDGSSAGQLTKIPVRTFPARVVDGYVEVSVSEEKE